MNIVPKTYTSRTIYFELKATDSFLGAGIDHAAQKTVIGKMQAQAYYDFSNVNFELQTDAPPRTFSFGTHEHSSMGTIRVPIAESHFIELLVVVVDVQIPFLLGLDTMKRFKIVLDTDNLRLSSKSEVWDVPITSKKGHLYYKWKPEILFAQSEPVRIHKHFYHPKSERLYSLMKRGVPERISPEVLRDFEKIENTCELCQRLSHAPHRFRVSLPEKDVVFNHTVCMDIMFLDGKSVLHVVDRDTKFSAAALLRSETIEETWETFMRIWVSVYIGFPDTIATDQGTQFQSQRWRTLLLMAGIKQKSSGVQSHNALGVGETYHSFLRQIYRKVHHATPGISPQNALMLAIKAMNDSAGPQGLVPTLLIFGVVPRITVVPSELPEQISRMAARHSARKEMTAVIAKDRLSRAIRANISAAAMNDIKVGFDVLVYREKPEDK